MTTPPRRRVLLAVTFYNGEAFARRTLESIARLDHREFDLDVLVLDDASPASGFSERLAELAREHGAVYSRSPRNLGIPRNVNLGLATAQRLGYDYVVISNSDVIYARNSLEVLFDVVTASPSAASVTAWSTNVEPYSIPNGAELYVESQEVADFIGTTLSAEFGTEVTDIPAGISFAMIVPVAVLDAVGLMDPVFRRGYGEESDWSARATTAGYDHLLAHGAYVYHAGRGSTLPAGVVVKNQVADWNNQRIVDHRSPMFNRSVDGFLRTNHLADAQNRALETLIRAAAVEYGYVVIDSSRDWSEPGPEVVSVSLRSIHYELSTALWCGFVVELDTDSRRVLDAVREALGGAEPLETNLHPVTSEHAPRYGYPIEL